MSLLLWLFLLIGTLRVNGEESIQEPLPSSFSNGGSGSGSAGGYLYEGSLFSINAWPTEFPPLCQEIPDNPGPYIALTPSYFRGLSNETAILHSYIDRLCGMGCIEVFFVDGTSKTFKFHDVMYVDDEASLGKEELGTDLVILNQDSEGLNHEEKRSVRWRWTTCNRLFPTHPFSSFPSSRLTPPPTITKAASESQGLLTMDHPGHRSVLDHMETATSVLVTSLASYSKCTHAPVISIECKTHTYSPVQTKPIIACSTIRTTVYKTTFYSLLPIDPSLPSRRSRSCPCSKPTTSWTNTSCYTFTSCSKGGEKSNRSPYIHHCSNNNNNESGSTGHLKRKVPVKIHGLTAVLLPDDMLSFMYEQYAKGKESSSCTHHGNDIKLCDLKKRIVRPCSKKKRSLSRLSGTI